jgi:hypothetical protein
LSHSYWHSTHASASGPPIRDRKYADLEMGSLAIVVLHPERIEAIAFGRFWYMQREYNSVLFWDF